MNDTFKVRGSSITSKFAYVRDTHGAKAEANLNQCFMGSPHFPSLDALWYPFTYYMEVNRTICERFLDGDARRLREVGQFSAGQALTTLYKAYAREATFADFLAKVRDLHSRFYSLGTMEPEIDRSGVQARVFLEGQPEYPMEDLYIAQGFYVGAAQLIGCEDIQSRIRKIDNGAVIEFKWAA